VIAALDPDASAPNDSRPTLAEIKATWPPTVDVSAGARALGVSRSALYEAVRTDRCPVETIKVGARTRLLTADLIRVLEGTGGHAHEGLV
jgi:hypothetical protein